MNAKLSIATLSFLVCSQAMAASKVLVLSGGANPTGNHYSQYLQTKTLTDGLRSQLGAANVDVLFGAGNSDRNPKLLADVHKQTKQNNRNYTDILFGVINGNAPATRSGVEDWFGAASAKIDTQTDTFFLFVSDHGMPQRGDPTFADNCINLWSYDAESGRPIGGDEECLSQTHLRSLIKENINAQRTVFAMSQCFSGGFHKMSVTKQNGYPAADKNVCGFTAITEDTTASGCTPDVDGPGYKGYERFFTQQITGVDVVSARPMPYSRKQTAKEAHYAAAVEDPTKDIPLSTSDFYLNEWARTITGKGFTPRSQGNLKAAVDTFNASVNKKLDDEKTVGLAGDLAAVVAFKLKNLHAQEDFLARLHPELAQVIKSGDIAQLTAARKNLYQKEQTLEAQANDISQDANNVYVNAVISPWVDALQSANPPISGTRLALEKTLLQSELNGSSVSALCSLHLSRLATAKQSDSYQTLRTHCGDRGDLRLEFASKNGNASQVEAYQNAMTKLNQIYEQIENASVTNDHLRRLLILRSTVAAAVALNQLADKQAIDETIGLDQCESATF